jgi:hypothetical protein
MNSCELPAPPGLFLPAIRNMGLFVDASRRMRRKVRVLEKSLWQRAAACQPSA